MTEQIASIATPFLKWAGGKRWLTASLKLSLGTGRYYEPFLGSGAVYFSTRPKRAVLSDVNAELIDTYRCVRDRPDELKLALDEHAKLHSANYYYQVRAAVPTGLIERASRFIYLNRTCWNGLYRVNRQGKFNVPIGTKDSVILDSDSWTGLAELLSGATLLNQDFEETIALADEGDTIFADPPYTVKHNHNGFIKYNESIFSWEDQIRLCDALSAAAGRGATVIATNAAHASIQELYGGLFSIETLSRASVLAGNAQARGVYDELLITANY